MTKDAAEMSPAGAKVRKSYRAIVVAAVAIVAAGALGYYAWTLRSSRVTALGQLSESRRSTKTCIDELTPHGTKITELNGKLKGCTTKAEKDATRYQTIEDNLNKMQKNLAASGDELDNLRKQREKTEKRLQAFRQLAAKLKAMRKAGTIDIVARKGHMLVELPAAVLFPSGSAVLSKQGKTALMEIGVALKKLPNRRFLIAGHTDTRRVRGRLYRNNWELSTARAVHVTEFLVDDVGMKPTSVVAAGNGEHDPVASNKTKQGRQKNRRIEIIVLPNLDELPPIPEELSVGTDTEPDAKPK